MIEDRKDGWRVYYRIKNPQVVGILDALNVFVGAKRLVSEAKAIPACPCPKCEQRQQGEGGKSKSKSSVRVAPTT